MSQVEKNFKQKELDSLLGKSALIEVDSFEDNECYLPLKNIKSKFDDLPDIEIWRDFKTGNESAFIYIYDKYFSVLYGYGHQFTRNTELIRDLIQDLFIGINVSRERLSDTNSIKFYLFKSLKTRYLAYKKQASKYVVDTDFMESYDFDVVFSTEQKIIDQQLNEERVARLNCAIQKLTPRQKEAIYYLYREGLTMDEIKCLMKMENRRSVQNIIYKAISILKSHLISFLGSIIFT